jgi:hypothetical protein
MPVVHTGCSILVFHIVPQETHFPPEWGNPQQTQTAHLHVDRKSPEQHGLAGGWIQAEGPLTNELVR